MEEENVTQLTTEKKEEEFTYPAADDSEFVYPTNDTVSSAQVLSMNEPNKEEVKDQSEEVNNLNN
jgi:hypothetical protein